MGFNGVQEMTKTTYGLFVIAVVLLVLSAVLEMPIAAGGGALIMLVGLIYAFVVTKRDLERSKYAEPAGDEPA